MTLLLLDLDDTLVDRGRIFGQWLADFTRPHELSDQDLAWITALDGGGYTPGTSSSPAWCSVSGSRRRCRTSSTNGPTTSPRATGVTPAYAKA